MATECTSFPITLMNRIRNMPDRFENAHTHSLTHAHAHARAYQPLMVHYRTVLILSELISVYARVRVCQTKLALDHQWRNDVFYGTGKRVSKDGTMFLGNWKKGLKHGDGIARVAHTSILDPIGACLLCPNGMCVCMCPYVKGYGSVRATTRMSYERAECFLLAHEGKRALSALNLFASWSRVFHDIEARLNSNPENRRRSKRGTPPRNQGENWTILQVGCRCQARNRPHSGLSPFHRSIIFPPLPLFTPLPVPNVTRMFEHAHSMHAYVRECMHAFV